jgi:hypothetical protein
MVIIELEKKKRNMNWDYVKEKTWSFGLFHLESFQIGLWETLMPH